MRAVKDSIQNIIQKAAALRKAGEHEEAKKFLEKELNERHEDKDIMMQLGIVYLELRKTEMARMMFERLRKLDEKNAQVCFNLGIAANIEGKWLRAYEHFLETMQLDSMHRGALGELVKISFNQKEGELMEKYSREYVEKWPNELEGICNLGVIHFENKRYEDVVELCRRNSEWAKQSWQINQLLGASMMELGRYNESIPYFKRAMELNPYNDNVLYNFANCYEKLRDYDSALTLVNRSLELRPNGADAWNLKGILLSRLGGSEELLNCYDKAIYYDPSNDTYRVNRAYQYLMQGDYLRGFKEFEHRFGMKTMYPDESLKRRSWQGEEIHNKRVLIMAEQGYGDSLQFVRYLSMLKKKIPDCTLFLMARDSLKSLFEYNFSKLATIVTGSNKPNYDVLTAPISFPFLFKTTLETVPANIPYIQAPEVSVKKWKTKLEGINKKRIGIVWTGSTLHKQDAARSMSLGAWKELLQTPDCMFVSLQVEYRGSDLQEAKQMGVLDFAKEIKDFSDTAGLIENLDLVISVDTSVVHLAGAMGKPVWVVLPRVAEWRWLEKREDSPWYPTARLFRGTGIGGWGNVMDAVKEALGGFKTQLKK
jgi:tetratricopeptide (TPR) repeat protein